ncbi:MAG TPA: flagellar biosynthetic protein FliO [Polyangia bacterium]
MFLSLACLPLAAVLINDVRSESSAGAITVDVATSEPVDRADVRGISGGSRRIFVYLQGTQAGRKSFGSGPEAIVVHPRARYTKLEIPTDGRCAEPMTVESTPAGIRVRAMCRESGVPAAMVPPPVRLPGKTEAEQPAPDAPLAALARTRSQHDSLRAALALPAEATDTEREAEGTAVDDKGHGAAATETTDKKAPAGAVAVAEKATENSAAGAGKPAAAPAKAAPLAPTAQPDAPLAAVASVESTASSSNNTSNNTSGSQGKSSGAASTLLAVALLAGLGVAATLFARRRATRVRMIRIVETASIGPRRSLVVACIGGRTMVLGVSEAGVSLLDAQAGPVSAPAVPEKAQSATLEDAALGLRGLLRGQVESQSDASEDAKHEGSLLSRLFHRTPASFEAPRREPAFDDLLSESLEDEELRRKLSLGMAGRVA